MRCKQCRWGNNQDMTAYYNFNNTRKLIHFEMNTMQETESLQSLKKIFSHSTLCRNDFLVTQFCKLTDASLKTINFLVACTRLYTSPCRSVGWSVGWLVGNAFAFLMFSGQFLHDCSCPIARD